MSAPVLPGSAITLYVRAIERPVPEGPETIFHLKSDLERSQRLAVLSELRQRYPDTQITTFAEVIILRRTFKVADC